MSHFDYEFIFPLGVFDQNIYNQCTLPDVNNSRLQGVKDIIIEIKRIFTEIPGLHIFSTFLQQETYRYKITLNNV